MKRLHYIDNLRWIIVLLVIVFHVIEIFTCTGTKIHYNSPGIPQMDIFGYFVYPWFMGCLFLISGMSARFALETRNDRDFFRERVHKLLIPFISYILIFAYPTAAFSFTAMGGWSDFAAVPKAVLVPIMMFIGMGHLWFVLELFIVSCVFLLIRKFDKKRRLEALGARMHLPHLLLLYIPLLLAAQVLNVLGVFRNLYFLLVFLIGYAAMPRKGLCDELQQNRYPLLFAAAVLFVLQTALYFGKPFSDVVNRPLAVLYGWVMILAVMANARVWMSGTSKLSEYLGKRSFLAYLFHYLPMLLIAYLVTKYMHLPIIFQYITVLALSLPATFLICEALIHVPFIGRIFGIKKKMLR